MPATAGCLWRPLWQESLAGYHGTLDILVAADQHPDVHDIMTHWLQGFMHHDHDASPSQPQLLLVAALETASLEPLQPLMAAKNMRMIRLPDAIGNVLRSVFAEVHPYNWWHEVMADGITHHLADNYDLGCFARDLNAVLRVPKRTLVIKQTMKRHGIHPLDVEKALAYFKKSNTSVEIEPEVKQEPIEEAPVMDTRLPHLDPEEWRRGKTEEGNKWLVNVSQGRLCVGGLLTAHEIRAIQASIDLPYDTGKRVLIFPKTIQQFHSMMSDIQSIIGKHEAHHLPDMRIMFIQAFRGELYELDYGFALIISLRGTMCVHGNLRGERNTLVDRFAREGKECVFHGGRLTDFINMLRDTPTADENAVARLLGLGDHARKIHRVLHLVRSESLLCANYDAFYMPCSILVVLHIERPRGL